MRLHWKAALCFMLQDPEWKKKIFVGGLWLLAFPPLGWPIALGYRKETLCGLVEGRTPLLPPWRGRWPIFLREGLKAAGIILIYFVPFLLGFWSMAIDDWSGVRDHAVELAVFGVAILFLLPICLPLIPPLYWYLFDWIELSGVEMVVIGLLFWGDDLCHARRVPAGLVARSFRRRAPSRSRGDVRWSEPADVSGGVGDLGDRDRSRAGFWTGRPVGDLLVLSRHRLCVQRGVVPIEHSRGPPTV